MRLLLVGALALTVLFPFAASAQQKPAQPPQSQPQQMPAIEGVSTAKVLAIGVGAVLGAVALEAIVVGDGAALIGGVAGGVIAAWWYDSASDSAGRATIRQPASLTASARFERVALAD